jgi:hypothetical protein
VKRLFEYGLIVILTLGVFALALKPIASATAEAFVATAARIDAANHGRTE